MTFEERNKLATDQLAKQKPITLEEAKAQAKWIKDNAVGGYRKGTIFLEIKNMAGFTNDEKEELYVLLRAWQGMGMGEQEIRNELKAYGI